MSLLRPGICKAMTENVCSVLHNAEIRTVIDFIVKDPEEIARTCDIAYKVSISLLPHSQITQWAWHPFHCCFRWLFDV